ncbi:MAG: translation initiation factor IF-3 [Acidimicrobiia bacterium]|nr:translation initiation factor IF-3 [Acidimicrobiia bacterium]
MTQPRNTGGTPITEPRVNERIRVKRVRLIAPDGGQIGEKDIDEARWLAAQLGLDLVEVAPDARPPVVRMMDYGKYKYDLSVKAREARKNQTRTVIKEVQFRPKIGASDFEVKRKRVVKFLRQGDKVKCTMRFRGREVAHPELGRDILQRLYEQVEPYAEIETMPRLDGRNMTMVLVPASDMPKDDEFESDATEDDEEYAPGEREAADPVDSVDEVQGVDEVSEREDASADVGDEDTDEVSESE